MVLANIVTFGFHSCHASQDTHTYHKDHLQQPYHACERGTKADKLGTCTLRYNQTLVRGKDGPGLAVGSRVVHICVRASE